MKVPFFNVRDHFYTHQSSYMNALHGVMGGGQVIGGDYVRSFEESFAAYYRAPYCVSVGNGTDALIIAMKMLGIGQGDEVITSSYSYIATLNAILQTGAKPVFVDVESRTFNLNPSLIEEKITDWTKAILPVHLYGQMADMKIIHEIATNHDLYVIEDAAEAHGAKHLNNGPGSLSDVACFSFYPTKQLGAFGDGGAILFKDERLALKARQYANHGGTEHYPGINSRLDALQAAWLSVKLKELDFWIERRRHLAQMYDDGFTGIEGMTIPGAGRDFFHSYYHYSILVPDRNNMIKYLADHEIGALKNFDYTLHEVYGENGSNYPEALKVSNHVLNLPLFPELDEHQVDYVIQTIKEYFS